MNFINPPEILPENIAHKSFFSKLYGFYPAKGFVEVERNDHLVHMKKQLGEV